ncbi:MAG TPA: DUF1501 domain-containing protein [Blastocatellia bacterium]|nr:DUF1501 domain-containing protein [Blastocatellia bacterium]
MAVTRRFFLKSSGIAMASLSAAPSFLKRTALAQTLATGKDRPIIIAIFQRGAMDGISAVIPFGDKNYYSVRPQIAVPQPKSGNADGAIDLDGYFGLHPALAPFKPIYDEGHLAIVHAVGSPDSTRSHFDAQDYMEAATPGNKGTADGWLNRYMQAKKDAKATPFRAVSFTANLPRTLLGPAPAIAMTNISDFGVRAGQGNGQVAKGFEELYSQGLSDALHGTGKEAFEAVKMLKRANPAQYTAANGANYPRSQFGQALLQIAQLIKSNLGVEVAFTDVGGWDTHANQGSSRGQLANRLQDFSQGIAALYKDLGDRMRNVVILTMTEFGRTIRQNGSGGTDHGHASVAFALGGPVKGGKVYGKWPGLAVDQLYEGRDLALTTDFRDVFSEIASRHLRATNLGAIFPGFSPNPLNFRGFIRG